MPFIIKPLESANPIWRRTLERVDRILQGQASEVAGTVAVNIMIHVLLEVNGPDLAAIDEMIDDLGDALKTGVRAQFKRDNNETLQ